MVMEVAWLPAGIVAKLATSQLTVGLRLKMARRAEKEKERAAVKRAARAPGREHFQGRHMFPTGPGRRVNMRGTAGTAAHMPLQIAQTK